MEAEAALRDHIPELLDGITEALAHEAHGFRSSSPASSPTCTPWPAETRASRLHEVTYEYGLLRSCILRRLEASAIHRRVRGRWRCWTS